MKNKNVVCLLAVLMVAGLSHAAISDFEDLSLAPNSFWNGADGSGGFTSGDVFFVNTYNTTYGSWDGFAYSNKVDITTPGYGNQYSAITGSGVADSDHYGVGFVGWAAPPTAVLNTVGAVQGAYFTNTTYAYLAMLNGEGPASTFGPDDWFKLTIEGFDAGTNSTGTVDFLLADGTDIVNEWTWVDLTELGNAVASLQFTLSSTDNDPQWGMNTPAYFAIDNLTTVVPEPASMALLGLGVLMMRRKKKLS